MSIGLMQVRPPFVEFVQIAVPDTQKSIELGRRVTKDVDMVHVMQPGSKDRYEAKAEDWLGQIKRKMLEGTHDAYPEEWVTGFRKKYEAWKEGQEGPLNGTSVKEWPQLSPSQAQNFITMHILTIEDVANLTEDAMQRVGMGTRELRDKARDWLAVSTKAQAAMNENEALRAEIAELREQLKALTAQPKNKPGRKPKVT